jgi:hypothetical protein
VSVLESPAETSVAVDIYHISQGLPRFANVAYTDPASGLAAIADLCRKDINLDTAFARDNYEDLSVWRQWNGQLTVVLAEPPRLVPASVAADFPNLPDWAARDQRRDEREVDMQMTSQPSPTGSRKRERQDRFVPLCSALIPVRPQSILLKKHANKLSQRKLSTSSWNQACLTVSLTIQTALH